MVKNPNWQEAGVLSINRCGRGVELGSTVKQLQVVVKAGLEPGTSGFQVRRLNHWATLPPPLSLLLLLLLLMLLLLLLLLLSFLKARGRC